MPYSVGLSQPMSIRNDSCQLAFATAK